MIRRAGFIRHVPDNAQDPAGNFRNIRRSRQCTPIPRQRPIIQLTRRNTNAKKELGPKKGGSDWTKRLRRGMGGAASVDCTGRAQLEAA